MLTNSRTSIDVSKLSELKQDSRAKSRYSHLTLTDSLRNPLVVLCIDNTSQEIMYIKKTNQGVQIMLESISNIVRQNILWKILGIKLDKCEKRYIIIYKHSVIGKIECNLLNSSYDLICKKKYKWIVKDIHATPKIPVNNPPITDVLDCMCITQDDQNKFVNFAELMQTEDLDERHSS